VTFIWRLWWKLRDEAHGLEWSGRAGLNLGRKLKPRPGPTIASGHKIRPRPGPWCTHGLARPGIFGPGPGRAVGPGCPCPGIVQPDRFKPRPDPNISHSIFPYSLSLDIPLSSTTRSGMHPRRRLPPLRPIPAVFGISHHRRCSAISSSTKSPMEPPN
jgi:hypothetical protein